jgi:hypothetical protein
MAETRQAADAEDAERRAAELEYKLLKIFVVRNLGETVRKTEIWKEFEILRCHKRICGRIGHQQNRIG